MGASVDQGHKNEEGEADMSKILFIMKYPLEDAYSVKNKFNGQMQAVEALGHEAYFVAYDHQYTYLIRGEQKTVIKKIWFGDWKQYIHTKAFFDLFDSVCRVLKKHSFDMVYMRDCPLDAYGSRMCAKIGKSGARFVVEIPTYPPERESQPTFLRRAYIKYSRFWWKRAERHTDLFVLIGDQADNYHGVPAINIDNGTHVDSHPCRQPQPDKDKIHMLALASMSMWHGYDRMIRGIAALDADTKKRVVLDMVGDEGDGSLTKWKDLTKELGVEEQVIFHGRKIGKELDGFFNIADVGICSLGLYRIGFSSGSILKLREYTSRGLPFVYAAEDPLVQEDLAFTCKIPNDDTPVDVAKVIGFAQRMREQKDVAAAMREYAREHMSWESQFEKVFDTLESVLERTAGGQK